MSDPLAAYELDMGTVCDMPECTRQATHILTCHQIDHCKAKNAHPSGATSFMFCPECAKRVGTTIAERVDAMKEAVVQDNTILECNQCHLHINALSDVLTIEYLYPLAKDMSNGAA